MLKLDNAANFRNCETNDLSSAFPQNIVYRNRASKRDSRLSGRKHVIIEFSIMHVTFKRGPHLELSIELSQFELIRQRFAFGMI
jgi:hypothetical protein